MKTKNFDPIAFAEYPMNTTLIYPMETVATFRCRLESGAAANWLINGSMPRHFIHLEPLLKFNNENGTVVDTLSITVTPEHNHTKIACVATIDGIPVVSPNATLTIVVGMSIRFCSVCFVNTVACMAMNIWNRFD
jgi:hypothetical protein